MKKKIGILLFVLLMIFIFPVCNRSPQSAPLETMPQVQNATQILRRDLLNGDEKEIYDGLLAASSDFGAYSFTEFGALPNDGEIDKMLERYRDILYYYVLIDHPEIFWCQGALELSYTSNGTSTDYKIQPTFLCTKPEAEMYLSQIETIVNEIVAAAPSTNEYDKAHYAHDWLIDNCVYYNSPLSTQESNLETSLYNLFVNGKSNCNGYSKGFKYLMDKLGVPCTIAVGVCSDGELHGWNIIMLNDEYYHLDVTWDDPVLPDGKQIKTHAYFCLTDEEMSKSRTILEGYETPSCISDKYNYFNHNGLIFSEFNENNFAAAVKYYIQNGEYAIEFKMSNRQAYNDAIDFLQNDQTLYDILSQNGVNTSNEFTYSSSDDVLTIFCFVENK